MRVSIRHIVDHLVWSASGTVWAIWRVAPSGSSYMSERTREEITGRVTALARSLPGSARLYGLCSLLDPGEVVARTVAGVDFDRHPYWAEVADAQLRLLAGPELVTPMEMHQRTWWLAVPLAVGGARAQVSAAVGSAWAEVSAVLGLKAAPVSARDVGDAQHQARQIAAEIGGGLGLRPARPAEVVWMYQHALARGGEEPLLGEARTSSSYGGSAASGRLRSPSYADLGQARLLEGGQEVTAAGKKRGGRGRGVAPVGRRWLQVESEFGTGYQAQLALAEMPESVRAEDADFLAQVERMPFPVDWACDVQVVSTEKVLAEVKKNKRNLVDQADQYAAQRETGLPSAMHSAADSLGEMDARASQAQGVEVEVQSVTVLTVWGRTPGECNERAGALMSALRGVNYRLVRPVGGQEDLFALGLPATTVRPPVREFVQHQLSEDWAMWGPFTGSRFGDDRGQMIGVSMDSGTLVPVLLDIADAPVRNASASWGAVGELGGGKSAFAKTVTSGVVDRGGRAIVIDRTPMREWALFAESAAGGRCQIIDAAEARLSIDPLRIFSGALGVKYALSYLTLQLGIGPMTQQGAVLKKAIKQAAASEFPCMAEVICALEDMAGTGDGVRAQDAMTLCDLLQVVAEDPLAACVFDAELPPTSLQGHLGSDFVVITTAGLTLPPREAVTNPELLRTQPLEALIGRAVLYLIAAMAREAAFTDRGRFCLVTVDECYWLTTSAEGLALVRELVDDGRKHAAGIGLCGHNVDELGDEAVRGLLAYRFLARTTDPVLARRGLEFLGLPSDDEDLLRRVTTDLSPIGDKDRAGEMLGRDARMQIGCFQVHVPRVPRLLDAIFTSPGQKARSGHAAASPAPARQTALVSAGSSR
ncbi:ATP-binding protein [Streptomyces sp. NPDC090053]|uniref:ATP-binding protein n=1 Tax=Streptomyces sp. NPDC090053 TaxID=3365932 RepID=UPI0037F581FA